MPSGSKIIYKGSLVNANLAEFDANIQAMLNAVGEVGVQIMRDVMEEKLPNGDATGETRKSVMWRTKVTYRRPEHEDESEVIDAPSTQATVNIGSAHPNATFMEYGTSSHVSPDGSQEFLDAIKDWMKIRNIPKKYFYIIVKRIRDEGTDARPYATETMTRLSDHAREMAYKATVNFLKTKQYKRPYNTGWNQGVSE